MTLGDLYPDVRLYSEVETNYDQGERGEWEGHMEEGRVRWEEGVGGTYGGRGGRWEEGVGEHMGRVGGDGDGRVMIQFVAHLWVCPL